MQKKKNLSNTIHTCGVMAKMTAGYQLLEILWPHHNAIFFLDEAFFFFLTEPVRLYHQQSFTIIANNTQAADCMTWPWACWVTMPHSLLNCSCAFCHQFLYITASKPIEIDSHSFYIGELSDLHRKR